MCGTSSSATWRCSSAVWPARCTTWRAATGIRLEELFFRIAELVGCRVIPERDASLARATDIPHLVGNPDKVRAATGWSPRFTLEQTLQSILDAEAH